MKYLFATGIGLGVTAIALAELSEFERPSQLTCEIQPAYRDFGPPEGCGGDSGQHPRGTVVTALTTGTGTVMPTGALAVFDPEHFQLEYQNIGSTKGRS